MACVRVLQNNTAVVRILVANSRKILHESEQSLVGTSDQVEADYEVYTNLKETLSLCRQVVAFQDDLQRLEGLAQTDPAEALELCDHLQRQKPALDRLMGVAPLVVRVGGLRSKIDQVMKRATAGLVEDFTLETYDKLLDAHTRAGRLLEFVEEYQRGIGRAMQQVPVRDIMGMLIDSGTVDDLTDIQSLIGNVPPERVDHAVMVLARSMGSIAIGLNRVLARHNNDKSGVVYRTLIDFRSFVAREIDTVLTSAVLGIKLDLATPLITTRVVMVVYGLVVLVQKQLGVDIKSTLSALVSAATTLVTGIMDSRRAVIQLVSQETLAPLSALDLTRLRSTLGAIHVGAGAMFVLDDPNEMDASPKTALATPIAFVDPEPFEMGDADLSPAIAAKKYFMAVMTNIPAPAEAETQPIGDQPVLTATALNIISTIGRMTALVELRPHVVKLVDHALHQYVGDVLGVLLRKVVVLFNVSAPSTDPQTIRGYLDAMGETLGKTTVTFDKKNVKVLSTYVTQIVALIESLALVADTLAYAGHRLSGSHSVAGENGAGAHVAGLIEFAGEFKAGVDALRSTAYRHVTLTALPNLQSIYSVVSGIKWDIIESEAEEQGSPYVSTILKDMSLFTAVLGQAVNGCLPSSSNQALCEQAGECIMAVMTEAFSRVRKCSVTGRALMARDLKQLVTGLLSLTGLEAIPGDDAVGTFIRGWYQVDKDFYAWLHEKGMNSFTAAQIVGLIHSVRVSDEFTQKTKLAYIAHVKELETHAQLKMQPDASLGMAAAKGVVRRKM